MRLNCVTIHMHEREEVHFSRQYLNQCISYTTCHTHCTDCDSYSVREIWGGMLPVLRIVAVSPVSHHPDCLPHVLLSKGRPPMLGWYPPEMSAKWALSLCFVLAHCQTSLSANVGSTGQFQLHLVGENKFRVSGFVVMRISNWWRN